MAKDQLEAFFDTLDRNIRQVVPRIVAEKATAYYKHRFTTKEWDGTPWPPAKKPPARGSLMVRSGALVNSIRPSLVSSTKVIISAGSGKVPYARVHNEGLRVRGIRYVRPHHNNNFMGSGRRVQIRSYAAKVDFKMPRRQFMGRSDKLDREIIDIIKKEFKL